MMKYAPGWVVGSSTSTSPSISKSFFRRGGAGGDGELNCGEKVDG